MSCVGQVSQPGGSPAGTGGRPGGNAGSLDVGRVDIHRLNNAEYDNTVRDLLGVTASARVSFIPDEKALGFDNIAEAFTMSDARYEQYFNSAEALVDQAFSDDGLRLRIVTCTPTSSADPTCANQIIKSFGLRAWRRPLTDGEVASLAKLTTDALTLGEDWNGAVKQVVRTMLASAQFLYRVEMDPNPSSGTAHPLDGYELASRLSYLLWSTMPDEPLFTLAGSGRVLDDAVLGAEIDRMLADPRGNEFVANFAGQWLGLRDLGSHQVEPTAFPDWDEPLRQSMIQEGMLYFTDFLTGDRPMSQFLTADVNFVDARLASLYGITPPAGNQPVRLTGISNQRRGFLGLASFLSVSSFSYRTAPTLRGKWVLENLLCDPVPPPPPNIPKLDDGMTASAATQSLNVRARLAEHRMNPLCAGCHSTLDPIGLGLENFDAIGRYRSTYANGDPIDASGVMPDGTKFNGINELSALLSNDPRLANCASEKLMTYALSRRIGDTDAGYLQQIRDKWSGQGLGMRALLKLVVQNDTFRYRHGQI